MNTSDDDDLSIEELIILAVKGAVLSIVAATIASIFCAATNSTSEEGEKAAHFFVWIIFFSSYLLHWYLLGKENRFVLFYWLGLIGIYFQSIAIVGMGLNTGESYEYLTYALGVFLHPIGTILGIITSVTFSSIKVFFAATLLFSIITVAGCGHLSNQENFSNKVILVGKYAIPIVSFLFSIIKFLMENI